MPYYQLALLGAPPVSVETELRDKLAKAINLLGMTLGGEVTLHVGNIIFSPVQKVSAAALYFGSNSQPEPTWLQYLLQQGVPVVPVASSAMTFKEEIPERLRPMNGVALDQTDTDRLTTILLECAGLLPRQRRVFISYKRDESRDVAVQLFEALSARRFEVFLDTHGISVGVDFQEQLWHKLADCDVVLMLDTPNYFASRWTRAELARTQVKLVGVLRVGWPGHPLDKRASLARNLELVASDFTSASLITDNAIARICSELESTRTTSIATRYKSLVSSVAKGIEVFGGSLIGVGARRRMLLSLPDGTNAFAFPVLGVPNSLTMQDALVEGHNSPVAVVFNHHGLQPQWLAHIEWLGSHIPSVKLIPEPDAAWIFADWEA